MIPAFQAGVDLPFQFEHLWVIRMLGGELRELMERFAWVAQLHPTDGGFQVKTIRRLQGSFQRSLNLVHSRPEKSGSSLGGTALHPSLEEAGLIHSIYSMKGAESATGMRAIDPAGCQGGREAECFLFHASPLLSAPEMAPAENGAHISAAFRVQKLFRRPAPQMLSTPATERD